MLSHDNAQACKHVCRALFLLTTFYHFSCMAQHPDLLLGADVYLSNCAACHQENGEGIAGAFPALKASPLVLGDTNELLQVVLAGRGGMPTFNASLSDEQVAAVVNYIRNSWGNTADTIQPEQARAVSSRMDAVADEGGRGN